jgi:hypothetical protein
LEGVAVTPEEYEHHVADVLRAEGWTTQVTSYTGDKGLDIIAQREGERVGVQVKMYGTTRRVNAGQVRELVGAALYADCTRGMIITDGELLESAAEAADKLKVEIRHVTAPAATPASVTDDAAPPVATAPPLGRSHTFGAIWREHIVPLTGQTIHTLEQRSPNLIVRVDDGGLTRQTAAGAPKLIPIEIFRWTVERLLRGETLTRDEINQHYPGRASSIVVAVLCSLPLFEQVKLASGVGLRMRRGIPGRLRS